MSGPVVSVATHGEGIRVLTIDKPPVNALGRELVEKLGTAIAELREDAAARCLILRFNCSRRASRWRWPRSRWPAG